MQRWAQACPFCNRSFVIWTPFSTRFGLSLYPFYSIPLSTHFRLSSYPFRRSNAIFNPFLAFITPISSFACHFGLSLHRFCRVPEYQWSRCEVKNRNRKATKYAAAMALNNATLMDVIPSKPGVRKPEKCTLSFASHAEVPLLTPGGANATIASTPIGDRNADPPSHLNPSPRLDPSRQSNKEQKAAPIVTHVDTHLEAEAKAEVDEEDDDDVATPTRPNMDLPDMEEVFSAGALHAWHSLNVDTRS